MYVQFDMILIVQAWNYIARFNCNAF